MVQYSDARLFMFQARAYALGLSAPPEFYLWPFDRLRRTCNGAGGEGSPLTPILTWAYRSYETSTAIHDVRYGIGGTEAEREAADRELLSNARREWRDVWGWLGYLRPAAWQERVKINAAYHTVRLCGAKYWTWKE